MGDKRGENGDMDQDKPPFLKSWNRLYLAVLLHLALLIAFFYLFAEAFD